MKKILFMICLFMLLPIICFAKEYKIAETDLSIVFDEEKWYVFTRDNIKDNEELAYLNVSEEYIQNLMEENSAYVDALLIKEDGTIIELFVRKSKLDSINNLSNFKDSYVLKLAKELAKKHNAKKYNVFESKYKYVHLSYSEKDLFLEEYYTIVNKDGYTITAQSENKYTKEEIKMIEDTIKTITFDVDKSLKDNDISFNWKRVLVYTICGAIIGGISGALAQIPRKKKENKSLKK